MVSLMTALWFGALRAPDRVSVKPHASPVLHAINFLLGGLDASYLPRLREFGGLQSYPSRSKDPDRVDFSTGSVGHRRDRADLERDRPPLRRRPLRRPGRRAADRAARRRRARRGRDLGGGRRPDGAGSSARCCGSSTSTASRSTASCPTSPRRGCGGCSRPPAGTCMMVKYGAARWSRTRRPARPHRRDAQRGVPAAAARARRRASCAGGLERRRVRRARRGAAARRARPRRPRPRRARSRPTARPTRGATGRRSSSPTRSRAGRCRPRATRPTTRRC